MKDFSTVNEPPTAAQWQPFSFDTQFEADDGGNRRVILIARIEFWEINSIF